MLNFDRGKEESDLRRGRLLYHIATVLGALAVLVVSTASWLYVYQDETPEELLKARR
ncbi:cyclic lactone autoinducer peptide [Paenibacillus sp. SYP-B4298]|uniref:cyclic lactone autoinducer peptide n=1 Tax=Paenibacillus sp. SYP-B4298 TaxID=2996034 RepID=UPI0022DE1922|nr:cyclic lactone autoinducer peptide [Paenibacillus sp. SYP-B4298]